MQRAPLCIAPVVGGDVVGVGEKRVGDVVEGVTGPGSDAPAHSGVLVRVAEDAVAGDADPLAVPHIALPLLASHCGVAWWTRVVGDGVLVKRTFLLLHGQREEWRGWWANAGPWQAVVTCVEDKVCAGRGVSGAGGWEDEGGLHHPAAPMGSISVLFHPLFWRAGYCNDMAGNAGAQIGRANYV